MHTVNTPNNCKIFFLPHSRTGNLMHSMTRRKRVRDHAYLIMFTKEERELLEAVAAKKHLSLAAYIRSTVLLDAEQVQPLAPSSSELEERRRRAG